MRQVHEVVSIRNFLAVSIMSAVFYSFRPLVGGPCTFDTRDRNKSTEIMSLRSRAIRIFQVVLCCHFSMFKMKLILCWRVP